MLFNLIFNFIFSLVLKKAYKKTADTVMHPQFKNSAYN